jgi:hypothetical protein
MKREAQDKSDVPENTMAKLFKIWHLICSIEEPICKRNVYTTAHDSRRVNVICHQE